MTQDSAATSAGTSISGTSITHAPAAGGSASTYSFNVATGALVTETLSLGGTAVSATAGEINQLDKTTAAAAEADKVAVYSGSAQLAGVLSTGAQTNITSLGTQLADLNMGSNKQD